MVKKIIHMARRSLYWTPLITIWLLFIGGLCIMWFDNPSEVFMNFLATSFGSVGMIWLDILFREKFIEPRT